MPKQTEQGPVNGNALTGRHFLASYAKQESTGLRVAVLLGTFATVLMLLQWVMFAWLAERIIVAEQSLTHYTTAIIILLLCVLCKALCTRFQSTIAQTASLNIRHNIRTRLQEHWRHTSPVVLQTTSVGAFATQYVEEVEAMDGYFSKYWPQQALSIISPLLILAVVAYLNWLCAILLLISAPLIPLFMVLVGMGAEKLNQQYSTVRQRLAGHFLDRVANLSTIRLLGAENAVFEEVERNSTGYRRVIMRTLKVAFLSSTVLEFFTSVAIAALAIYIGFSLYGAITWGPAEGLSLFSGLAILILAPEFFQPLRNLSAFYHDRASALGAANNLVLALGDKGEKKAISHSRGEFNALSLQQVKVAYHAKAALSPEINLQAQRGDLVAVLGPSGCGKTTLLNTLAGFTPSISGKVHFSPSYPNSMAYLPQQAWIKNQSIYETLRVFAPKASKKDMFDVLKQLGLADELSLKHKGLDTLIGEHGKGLSGGQMQRIAFARILLNTAPLVLLDEPTARLDELSKHYIVEALSILRQRALVIVATHDPLLIKLSNKQVNLRPTQAKGNQLT